MTTTKYLYVFLEQEKVHMREDELGRFHFLEGKGINTRKKAEFQDK